MNGIVYYIMRPQLHFNFILFLRKMIAVDPFSHFFYKRMNVIYISGGFLSWILIIWYQRKYKAWNIYFLILNSQEKKYIIFCRSNKRIYISLDNFFSKEFYIKLYRNKSDYYHVMFLKTNFYPSILLHRGAHYTSGEK